jgi:Uncharacterized protein conserved in bacteria
MRQYRQLWFVQL